MLGLRPKSAGDYSTVKDVRLELSSVFYEASSRRKQASMAALGQSRHFSRRPAASGLPRSTDIVGARPHVSKVP